MCVNLTAPHNSVSTRRDKHTSCLTTRLITLLVPALTTGQVKPSDPHSLVPDYPVGYPLVFRGGNRCLWGGLTNLFVSTLQYSPPKRAVVQ